MFNNILQKQIVKLVDLEQCPVKLTIHSTREIEWLIHIAKTSIETLPSLEIALLEDGKKYLVKGHALLDALKFIGKTEFRANIYLVKNIIDATILHVKMSQNSPINPLAVLDLRDYLVNNGFSIEQVTDICILDPTYVNLLKCDLSSEAKEKLTKLNKMLSTKVGRVEMPAYMIEMISKRPKEIQEEIVDRICQYIGDEKTLTERDFVFPNQIQIRLYTEISKKSEKRNALFFQKEEFDKSSNKHNNNTNNKARNHIESKEKSMLTDNTSHLAIMETENKVFRIDWKAKTFAEVKNYKDEFIIIQDSRRLKKIFSISQNHIKFLDLDDDDHPKVYQIEDVEELKIITKEISKNEKFKGLLITK
jgi:hypothetical protein